MSDEMRRLSTLAASINIELSLTQIERFQLYLDILLFWNKRINLTAITEPSDIIVRHFLDSLICSTVTGDLESQRLADIGTGAGFPGIPLKILFPTLRLTLIESKQKKADFLNHLSQELDLDDVQIESSRAESLGHQPAYREQYDWAVSRAVARMSTLVEYLLPLCRVGGSALALKGPNAPDELDEAASAIRLLGGIKPILKDVKVPLLQETRYLVVIKKGQKTPDQFPRRIGVAAKRPL